MNKKPEKRDGFYMNVTQEERKLIEELKENYAINLSQAFKLFLKEMIGRLKK
jgi:hypothetical protein